MINKLVKLYLKIKMNSKRPWLFNLDILLFIKLKLCTITCRRLFCLILVDFKNRIYFL